MFWPKVSSPPCFRIQGGYCERDTQTNEQKILCLIYSPNTGYSHSSNVCCQWSALFVLAAVYPGPGHSTATLVPLSCHSSTTRLSWRADKSGNNNWEELIWALGRGSSFSQKLTHILSQTAAEKRVDWLLQQKIGPKKVPRKMSKSQQKLQHDQTKKK